MFHHLFIVIKTQAEYERKRRCSTSLWFNNFTIQYCTLVLCKWHLMLDITDWWYTIEDHEKSTPPLPVLRWDTWFFWMTARQYHHWQHPPTNIHHSPSYVCVVNYSLDNPSSRTTGLISGLVEGVHFPWYSIVHYLYNYTVHLLLCLLALGLHICGQRYTIL